MHQWAEIAKEWTIIAAFLSLVIGAISTAVYWLWKQSRLITVIVSEFRPNGGSSLRDAINNIQSTITVVDARQWAIVAGLKDPMWESDANGGCVRTNRALLDLVQRTFDEMSGSGWENIICPHDRARVWDEWNASVARRRTFESVYCVRNKNGQEYRVRAIAIPFHNTSGEVVGYVGRYSQVIDKTAPIT